MANLYKFVQSQIAQIHTNSTTVSICFCKIYSCPVGLGANNHGGIYLQIILFCANYSI